MERRQRAVGAGVRGRHVGGAAVGRARGAVDAAAAARAGRAARARARAHRLAHRARGPRPAALRVPRPARPRLQV